MILVNGKRFGTRGPNDHVGEMAAIQPAQRRSATVLASEHSIILKLTEPQLAALGNKYPEIYRAIAKELARRLMQRNLFIAAARDRIRVFIISTVEALDIARAIQNAFDHDPFTVVIWTDGVFRASLYPLESLEREIDQSDFAIAIAQPDDITHSRDTAVRTPRDNVIFELGFFMGRLGRHDRFCLSHAAKRSRFHPTFRASRQSGADLQPEESRCGPRPGMQQGWRYRQRSRTKQLMAACGT